MSKTFRDTIQYKQNLYQRASNEVKRISKKIDTFRQQLNQYRSPSYNDAFENVSYNTSRIKYQKKNKLNFDSHTTPLRKQFKDTSRRVEQKIHNSCRQWQNVTSTLQKDKKEMIKKMAVLEEQIQKKRIKINIMRSYFKEKNRQIQQFNKQKTMENLYLAYLGQHYKKTTRSLKSQLQISDSSEFQQKPQSYQ